MDNNKNKNKIIIEDLVLSSLLNKSNNTHSLFNKLKSSKNVFKNTYTLDTHSNIDITNKISTIISLHNLPLSSEHSTQLGEIKYAKDYGINIVKNFNIYENGIEIIMINGKYLIIDRKWDFIIPEITIDYYKNITINWVSNSDNNVKYFNCNNNYDDNDDDNDNEINNCKCWHTNKNSCCCVAIKNKKKIKRDITQIAELHMSLYGIITDLFWIDDKNTNYRENYLPSHISFSRDSNHSLCKWFLKYNTNKNTHFIIKCCNE